MTTAWLAPGLFTLRTLGGRYDEVSVNRDGTAERLTADGWERVDLDDYRAVGSGEHPAAGARDGARVEGSPAGAKEGHGWSVSATRTIGNVGGSRLAYYASFAHEIDKAVAARYGWTVEYDAAGAKYTITASDLDAVRDEPVMPDETPLADMAKPDEVFAPRHPSPGPCPTCGVQRRERGEVRVHYWKCSCPVRPEHVYEAKIDGGEMGWVAVSHFDAEYWATGAQYKTVSVEHPTRDGAVSAWREALAEAQRREDGK